MNELALTGGKKAVISDLGTESLVPRVTEEGIVRVVELMRRGEISRTPIVAEFEQKFASYLGAKYALCEGNGTSTLISAMYAVGIGPGDEVIVPSFSFWATAACVLPMHGIPVFCDVDPDTYNMDAKQIRSKITPRTKAIVLVHVYGNPADMNEIMAISHEYDIRVIEDCSHAHGAVWDEWKVGTIGDIGCFSLQAEKLLSAGEGGILVTNNFTYYQRAVALGHYEKLQNLPLCEFSKFGVTGLGYKFRPHPLGIAIADSNLQRLDELNEIRNKNAKYIESELLHIKALCPQKVHKEAKRQYSYQYVKYVKEEFADIPIVAVIRALQAEGVQCTLCEFGKYHKSALFMEEYTFANGKSVIENIPFYKYGETLPISEAISNSIFMMSPRFEKECPELIKQYITAYEKVFSNVNQLKAYSIANHLSEEGHSSMDLAEASIKYRT